MNIAYRWQEGVGDGGQHAASPSLSSKEKVRACCYIIFPLKHDHITASLGYKIYNTRQQFPTLVAEQERRKHEEDLLEDVFKGYKMRKAHFEYRLTCLRKQVNLSA